MSNSGKDPFTAVPVTARRWPALVRLFGPSGACEGCWCMWWREPRKQFRERRGAGNRRAFNRLVRRGPAPGILILKGRTPVGWCAIAPRDRTPQLDRSRALPRVDDAEVWSVTCLFVAREYRGKGMSGVLVGRALRYAAARGARIVEAYPVSPGDRRIPAPARYTGTFGTYARAGFLEVRRGPTGRPIMRMVLGGPGRRASN